MQCLAGYKSDSEDDKSDDKFAGVLSLTRGAENTQLALPGSKRIKNGYILGPSNPFTETEDKIVPVFYDPALFIQNYNSMIREAPTDPKPTVFSDIPPPPPMCTTKPPSFKNSDRYKRLKLATGDSYLEKATENISSLWVEDESPDEPASTEPVVEEQNVKHIQHLKDKVEKIQSKKVEETPEFAPFFEAIHDPSAFANFQTSTTALDFLGRSWLHSDEKIQTQTRTLLPKKKLSTLRGHKKVVNYAAWVNDNIVLSASADKTVKAWTRNEQKCAMSYSHSSPVKCLDFLDNDGEFVSGSKQGVVKIWNLETGVLNHSVQLGSSVNHVKYSDLNAVFVCCDDNKVVQLDLRQKEVVNVYKGHEAGVLSLCFCDDKRRLVTAGKDKKLCVWEYGSDTPVFTESSPYGQVARSLVSHPREASQFLSQGAEGTITLLQLESAKTRKLKTFTGHSVKSYDIHLDVDQFGEFVASGDSTGKALIWSMESGKVVKTLSAHRNPCLSVKFRNNSLLTCGMDSVVSVYGR